VERQAALEISDGLLVIAAARHEVPEVGNRESEIAGDGGVFIVPIIRVEQIEGPSHSRGGERADLRRDWPLDLEQTGSECRALRSGRQRCRPRDP
jgi:hypothetical protein